MGIHLEPGPDLVNPLGIFTFGSIVFADKSRMDRVTRSPTSFSQPLLPTAFMFKASFVFASEDSYFLDYESTEDFLRVPRLLRVMKCRNPERIQPFLVDQFNQPMGQQVRLTFEDAVLLRFSQGEPNWYVERKRYAKLANLSK